MKILVDCHSFDNEGFQGVTSYIRGLYNENILKFPDNDYFLCSSNIDNLKSFFPQKKNVHFIKLKFNSSIIRLCFEMSYIILKYNIDFLHVQYKLPLFRFCKEIVSMHDVLFIDYPKYFGLKFTVLNKFFYRFSAKRADLITTISDYSKDRISKWFKIPKDKIINSSLGLDQNLILNSKKQLSDPRKKLNIENYILYVSRFEKRKNHIGLIKALHCDELSDQNLVFVGSDTHNEDKFKTFKKIKKNIYWLKNISIDDLSSLYSFATLTVYPSFCEGLGIPPLESLLFKTNCVCSNTTAMNDYKEYMIATFDPNDINDIRKKIIESIDKPFNINIKKIEERYSWKYTSESLMKKLLIL